LPGGEGPPPAWSRYLPHLATLVALGYGVDQIASTLRLSRGRVVDILMDFFGGIKNARSFLLNPLLEKLKGYGIERTSIYEGFKHYFHSIHRDFEIDEAQLIKRAMSGYTMEQLVPELWKSVAKLREEINLLIPTKLPNLPIHMESRRLQDKNSPTYEDLKIHLQANLILVYMYEGLSREEIARKFKTPSKPNGQSTNFVSERVKKVFGLDFRLLKSIINPNVLPYIMLGKSQSEIKNFFNIQGLEVQLSQDSYNRIKTALNSLLRYIRQESLLAHRDPAYVDMIKHRQDILNNDQDLAKRFARLGLVGPLIEIMLRFGCTVNDILETIDIYSSEEDLRLDLQLIFRGLPADFFHSNFLGTEHYESVMPSRYVKFLDAIFNLYSSIS